MGIAKFVVWISGDGKESGLGHKAIGYGLKERATILYTVLKI